MSADNKQIRFTFRALFSMGKAGQKGAINTDPALTENRLARGGD